MVFEINKYSPNSGARAPLSLDAEASLGRTPQPFPNAFVAFVRFDRKKKSSGVEVIRGGVCVRARAAKIALLAVSLTLRFRFSRFGAVNAEATRMPNVGTTCRRNRDVIFSTSPALKAAYLGAGAEGHARNEAK